MFDNYRRFLDLLWIIILGKNIGKIQCLDGFLWVNGHGIFLLLEVYNFRTYFWERECTPGSVYSFFWGGGWCLQGKSLCFKIAVFRILQSLNFMTQNGPRSREPTENKLVGDYKRKLLTEQFSWIGWCFTQIWRYSSHLKTVCCSNQHLSKGMNLLNDSYTGKRIVCSEFALNQDELRPRYRRMFDS